MTDGNRCIPRFVVGTGRCGSTRLSKMLAEYPGLTLFDEVFAGINPETTFTAHPITGDAFVESRCASRGDP